MLINTICCVCVWNEILRGKNESEYIEFQNFEHSVYLRFILISVTSQRKQYFMLKKKKSKTY